jgi:hypothetical protein
MFNNLPVSIRAAGVACIINEHMDDQTEQAEVKKQQDIQRQIF